MRFASLVDAERTAVFVATGSVSADIHLRPTEPTTLLSPVQYREPGKGKSSWNERLLPMPCGSHGSLSAAQITTC